MTYEAADQLLAHPVALLAIPAFVPALAAVGVIIYVARKDRIAEREENELLRRALGEDQK